jgi:aminoglycoside 6'-N-acetyltransferase I
MRISPFPTDDESVGEQAAALLVEGFRLHWPRAWPDREAARREVAEALDPARICFVAIEPGRGLVGWIGGQPQYDGNVWELHPLVVAEDRRGLGHGRALVLAFEREAARRGGLTAWLGTDDEDGRTSLSGADLFADPWAQVASIRNLAGHPYGFYQRLGYAIVGVVPDANGRGRPDILMAKRLG